MTDERLGDGMWHTIEALPRGSGVVFRHFGTPPDTRRAMFQRLRRIAQRKGLVILRAGSQRFTGEHGVHGEKNGHVGALISWPVHSRAEAVAGVRAGAALLFVSPVYPTRSHPGAPALGPLRAAMIGGIDRPLIALGGVDSHRFRRLQQLGFYGWAGIDAFQRCPIRQKRNAVPT